MKYVLTLIIGMMVIACSKKSVAPSVSQDIKALFSEKSVVINEQVNLIGQQVEIKNKSLTIQKGGRLINGTIKCTNCTITAPPEQIFDRVTLTGNWTGNKGNLEWWTGNDFTNAMRNLDVLNTLIQAGFRVEVRRMIPIQAKDDKSVLNPHRLIDIVGINREKSGLILVTKHANQFNNYFQSAKGFNMHLENLTLMSEDFKNGIYTDKETDYLFSGSYYQSTYNPDAKPSIDSIIVRNIDVRGNIHLANYGAHSNNQSLEEFAINNIVKKVEVTGCIFQNANSVFSFSNMGYGDIIVKNNQVFDFSGSFLSVPESGMDDRYYESNRSNKKYVLFENNTFKNSRVVKVAKDRAMTPCVIKGGKGSMDFINNTLENLLSDSPDADVHTFYYSCSQPGKFTAKNNIIKNVCGRGSLEYPASLIKDRWTDAFIFENNTVTLDRESLVKIGVLKNKNEDLSKIKGDRFNFVFIQAGGQQEFDKVVRIKNNTFSMPYVNRSTEMYDAKEFIFENNKVNIEYFGPSDREISISRDNSFFLGRQRLDRPEKQPAMDMILSNNVIHINKTGDKLFNYVNFSDGVQNGYGTSIDKNYNYKNVILEDKFEVENTEVGMSVPDGENQIFKPIIIGQNNSFFLNDAANGNHLRPNAKKLISNISLSSAQWNIDMSPFVFMPNSTQKMEVKNHNGKEIRLFNYIYFTSLYNLINEENQLIRIKLTGKNKSGTTFQQEYDLALDQKSRIFFGEDISGNFLEFGPSNANQIPLELKNGVASKGVPSNVPKLVMFAGDRHLKVAEIKFINCDNLVSYTIECQIYNIGRSKPTQAQFRKEVERVISY